MTKALFDTIRDIKGSSLTQAEVDRVNAAIGGVAVPANSQGPDHLALFKLVASPNAKPEVVAGMAATFTENAAAYKMVTRERIAEFIAQIANETGGFSTFVENLNYSANALINTWPSRYNAGNVAVYARQPQKIAEKSYGGRMGNGPEGSGDGWKYRGRGALQLTGKEAYRQAGERLGMDLVGNPDLAAEPRGSVLIALDFWRQNAVNTPIDAGDFRKARKITNGGAIGLEHVATLRNKLLGAIK